MNDAQNNTPPETTGEGQFEAFKSAAATPQQARDEIAAMVLDAASAIYAQAKGLKRKEKIRLGDRLTDIGERIAAIEYS